jgi:hypothetical protein
LTATWPLVSGAGEDHFRGVNGAVDARAAFGRAVELDVELAEEIDLVLGVPRDAFTAVAQLVEQRPEEVKRSYVAG